MAFSPLYVGATHMVLQVTWKDDAGLPIDLTGATINMRYKGDAYTGADGASHQSPNTGTITNAALGQFTFQPAAADLAVAGTYQWQFIATYIDTTVLKSDPITIQIKPAV
jgi:hypothetical protein